MPTQNLPCKEIVRLYNLRLSQGRIRLTRDYPTDVAGGVSPFANFVVQFGIIDTVRKF